MMFILIVSWAVATAGGEDYSSKEMYRRQAVAMQEFNSAEACQLASLEAQKIARNIRVVCVPKGKL